MSFAGVWDQRGSCHCQYWEFSIIETHEGKLLGVTINRELKFKKHVQSIYSKAGKKLNALARLCTYLSINVKFS